MCVVLLVPHRFTIFLVPKRGGLFQWFFNDLVITPESKMNLKELNIIFLSKKNVFLHMPLPLSLHIRSCVVKTFIYMKKNEGIIAPSISPIRLGYILHCSSLLLPL